MEAGLRLDVGENRLITGYVFLSNANRSKIKG